MNRVLVTPLILGLVTLASPAPARASADVDPSRTVTSRTAVQAPGVLQRSIAAAAHRAVLQAPQTATGPASRSRMGCRTGAVLMGAAGAAIATAVVKHAHWASSGATKSPGAAPPSSVGASVAIGAVLAGAGIFTLAKTCGE